MGRMPSAVGYQPTLANELGALQERITSTRDGSITSVQAVYVPADDLTDPAPATTFAHLDATTVLSLRAEQKLGAGLPKAGKEPVIIPGSAAKAHPLLVHSKAGNQGQCARLQCGLPTVVSWAGWHPRSGCS